jgi:hypothetical protein
MAAYKAPDFNERAAAALAAKQRKIELLRDKPTADPAAIAARQAAREAKEAAEAERRAAKRAAQEQAKADKKAAALAAAEAAKPAPKKEVVVPSAAELKAARDARYAARKARQR